MLETPGGIIDPQDGAPAVAAARELREETGYHSDELIPLGSVHPNPATHTNRCHLFLARNARLAGAPQWDGTEELEVRLVPKHEVERLIADGTVSHALAVTALLLARLRW
jgi:8-oxo-dGTP pyrophosphatase MutT (NUDIX family)